MHDTPGQANAVRAPLSAFLSWRYGDTPEKGGAFLRDAFGEVWNPYSWRAHLAQVARLGARTHLGRLQYSLREHLRGRGGFSFMRRSHPGSPANLVVLPRGRRGVVIVDPAGKSFWKIVATSFGGADNEARAHSALDQLGLTSYALRLLSHGSLPGGEYDYLRFDLLRGARHVAPGERRALLQGRVTEMLRELYSRSLVAIIAGEAYLDALRQAYARTECSRCLDLHFDLAAGVLSNSINPYVVKARIHGDVGESNAMYLGRRVLLIDWALSDVGNVFRDLFRQEHRNARYSRAFWAELLDPPQVNSEFANGWWPVYQRMINECTDVHYTEEDLPFQMLVSLLERVVFDLETHRSSRWEDVRPTTQIMIRMVEELN